MPSALRPRVRRVAGRFYAYGHAPNDAVRLAVEVAHREQAIIAAVAADEPEADLERVASLAADYYAKPTAQAVEAVLAALVAERQAAADARADATARVTAALEGYVLPPGTTAAERDALAVRAVEILLLEAPAAELSPERAIALARARKDFSPS